MAKTFSCIFSGIQAAASAACKRPKPCSSDVTKGQGLAAENVRGLIENALEAITMKCPYPIRNGPFPFGRLGLIFKVDASAAPSPRIPELPFAL